MIDQTKKPRGHASVGGNASLILPAVAAFIVVFLLYVGCSFLRGGSVKEPGAAKHGQRQVDLANIVSTNLERMRATGKALDAPGFVGEAKAWIAADPVAALNFLESHSAGRVISQSDILGLLERSSKKDPYSLVQIAKGLENRQLADALFNRAFALAMEKSPDMALNLIPSMPAHLANHLESQAAKGIVEKDGATGFEGAFSRFTNQYSAQTALEALVRTDPNSAFALFDKYESKIAALPPFGKQGAVGMIGWLIGVGQPDTAAAMEWLRQKPASPYIDGQIAEALAQAVAKQPDSAAAILRNYNADSLSDMVLSKAAVRIAKTNPDSAQRLIASISSYNDRIDAYKQSGFWLGQVKTEKALDFMAAIPNSLDRSQSLAALSDPLLKSDPTGFFEGSAAHLQDAAFSRVVFSVIGTALQRATPDLGNPPLSSLRSLSPAAKAEMLQAAPKLLPTAQRALLVSLLK